MTYRAYSGIGSRQTPPPVIEAMIAYARRLATIGFTLRSGHAAGADRAFEYGCGKEKEIYTANGAISRTAYTIAREFHPAWHRCAPFVKKLHARNSHIMLGVLDCDDPSEFTICWTKDGTATGGTGQGLRIAASNEIPIFNLFNLSDVERLESLLTTLEANHGT